MKGFARGLIIGIILISIIAYMKFDMLSSKMIRVKFRNEELIKQRDKTLYKLDKAEKYITTIGYNFDNYRIRVDRELEMLGKWDNRFVKK